MSGLVSREGFQGTCGARARGRRTDWCWKLWKCTRSSHRSSPMGVVGARDLALNFGAVSFRMLLAASNRMLIKKCKGSCLLVPRAREF